MQETSPKKWIEIADIGAGDPAFDIKYWQAQGPEAIFTAAWELVVLAHEVKGGDPSELRLDRSAFSIEDI